MRTSRPWPSLRPRASRASRRAGRRRSRSSCRCAAARRVVAVIARLPPAAGRAGEGLGDVEPARRRPAPSATQVGVVAVDALGDQQAEVVAPTRAPSRAASSGPQVQVSPLGAVELDPDLGRRAPRGRHRRRRSRGCGPRCGRRAGSGRCARAADAERLVARRGGGPRSP